MYNNILISINEGIATLTINRPSKLNALNHETLSEIKEAVLGFYTNTEVRGIIITGTGEKAFVAGADISEIAKLNASEASQASAFGQSVFSVIENSPKPVIAAVNGFSLGGGCELAIACHIRVASENAIFGQPEVNLGIIPGYGATQRLPYLIGKAKAIELMLSAENIKADEALNLGLISYIFPQNELLTQAHILAKKITAKSSVTTERILAAVNVAYHEPENYQTEATLFGECTQSEDFKEGTTAFLEKRKAVFKDK